MIIVIVEGKNPKQIKGIGIEIDKITTPNMVSRKNACLDTSSWYWSTPSTVQKSKKLPENQNEVDIRLFTVDCHCEMTLKQNIEVLRGKCLHRILFPTVSGS